MNLRWWDDRTYQSILLMVLLQRILVKFDIFGEEMWSNTMATIVVAVVPSHCFTSRNRQVFEQ